MTASREPPAIEYGLYEAADAPRVSALLGRVFSRRDPPAVAAGITASEFEAFVRLFCPHVAEDRLTVVARLADSGQLVGVMLTEDGASPPPEGLERLAPGFEPIFDILGQLDSEYRGERTPPRGESLHLFLLGVADQAVGGGVAQELVRRSLAHGVDRGYRLAFTEATNQVSQHIFRKLGFVERVRRSYATHRFEGRAAFESVAEHGGPVLMDRELSA